MERVAERRKIEGDVPTVTGTAPSVEQRQHMVRVIHNHGNPVNKHYVTLSCGHKASVRQMPRGGCKTCWKAFFLGAPDIAHAVGMVLNNPDKSWTAAMEASQGKEFLKQAKFFLQQQAQESQQEAA